MKPGGPLRPCGKRFATELDARCSKRGQQPGAVFGECRLRECEGGWHVVTLKDAARARSATAGTGPSRPVRALVLARDGHACVSCGKPAGSGTWYSLQHRVARGHGGGNSPANIIVLCGSATSPGCHRRAEDRDREFQARGYWLESWQDPRLEGVMYFSPEGSGFTAWLDDDGGLSFEPPAAGAA